jgi:putative FmdB family regulatory protein
MPTYDYECDKCGHSFEKFQSISEDRIKTCPVCKGPVRRLIGTGAGIIFKGSGFYATDYRSESYKKSAEKDKPADKPAKSESSSDSSAKGGQSGSSGSSSDGDAGKAAAGG